MTSFPKRIMDNVFRIKIASNFDRVYKKLIKKDKKLLKIVPKVVREISKNPFEKNLYTHKVNSRNYGLTYASKVTGDLRLIWIFDHKETSIILLTIGSHSGNKRVYK